MAKNRCTICNEWTDRKYSPDGESALYFCNAHRETVNVAYMLLMANDVKGYERLISESKARWRKQHRK